MVNIGVLDKVGALGIDRAPYLRIERNKPEASMAGKSAIAVSYSMADVVVVPNGSDPG